MKSFRDLVKPEKIVESPVGKVGRTKDSEALSHIENSDLAKQFRKIVKQLGGKNVARQLLSGMNQACKKIEILESKSSSIEEFLRENGFKIKAENAQFSKKEIEFFSEEDAKEAKEDLEESKFNKSFNIELKGKKIIYTNK